MRWMFDAKFATTMRPGASPKMRSKGACRSRSDPERPDRSALVESLSRSRTPSSPRRRKRSMSVGRRRVQLEVAGVHHAADRGLDRERDRVRDRVAYGHRLDAKRAQLHGIADANLAGV